MFLLRSEKTLRKLTRGMRRVGQSGAEIPRGVTMTTRTVLMIVLAVLAIAAGAAVALAQSSKSTICNKSGSVAYTTSVLTSDLSKYVPPGSLGACPSSPSR